MVDVVLFVGLALALGGLVGVVFATGHRRKALRSVVLGFVLFAGAAPFLDPLDPEERALREAAEAAERAEAEAAAAAKEAADRKAGFHCLSRWDGSHLDFVEDVRDSLRDPNSFEHVETRVTPVDDEGRHMLVMTYRARNGFGGMNVGRAVAQVDNATCEATILRVE